MVAIMQDMGLFLLLPLVLTGMHKAQQQQEQEHQ